MSTYPKIYIAGHKGMVGQAIYRNLLLAGHPLDSIITIDREKLDLTNQSETNDFFAKEKPDQVFIAAARVGGILANMSYPANFIYDNLMIGSNLIDAAHRNGVERLIFLGSSCIYPRDIPVPIDENRLMTGALELSNEPYAIAKIAGIKLCQYYNQQYGRDYRCLMPTNLYGLGDRYDNNGSHVIPALIMRFHEAVILGSKEIIVWGSGKPLREFLYVDDFAEAAILIMSLSKKDWFSNFKSDQILNIGSGYEISIAELAHSIAKITGFKGRIIFDSSKPDGNPRKLLDSSKIKSLGWFPKIKIWEGLELTYKHFAQLQMTVA